jgi:hypothetical protein
LAWSAPPHGTPVWQAAAASRAHHRQPRKLAPGRRDLLAQLLAPILALALRERRS